MRRSPRLQVCDLGYGVLRDTGYMIRDALRVDKSAIFSTIIRVYLGATSTHETPLCVLLPPPSGGLVMMCGGAGTRVQRYNPVTRRRSHLPGEYTA